MQIHGTCQKIMGSTFFATESRVTLKGIKEIKFTGEQPGIRCHNGITAFFLRFLNKIVDVTDANGETYHLNRNSLNQWVNRNAPDKLIPERASLAKYDEKQISNLFDQIISKKTGADKQITSVNKQIVDSPSEAISEYTYQKFSEIRRMLKRNNVQRDLGSIAASIYADYKHDYARKSFFDRMVHGFISAFGMRHSHVELEKAYQALQQEIPQQMTFSTLGASLRLTQSAEAIEKRRKLHRDPANKEYGRVALSKNPLAKAIKEKVEARKTELEKCTPQQRAIRIAQLKEEACNEVYNIHLDQCIEEGFYDPEIIPFDVDHLLGKPRELTEQITSTGQLKQLLKNELSLLKGSGKLNEAQAHRLQHDAMDVAELYMQSFPGKSYRDVFLFVRDLIRMATYQEYYDKSSFNGSDHGSKHIHNNILGALALHKTMKKGEDYTVKDKFIEELTHFYHDIGYSVGLAASNFDCCKDHPFIGAKMIEANCNYFLHYLDDISYRTLHRCVLNHAIIYPDLTAREEENGVHPNMVRAVTSISDACAVTYDRKTQEFWEQPRALVALSRIKSFLVLFPEYQKKLGDDIVKGKWAGFDDNNPMDVMAWEVYLHARQELEAMVKEYDIPQEKRDLFKQAIAQQFNAFTANITLGQYGAVLAGLEAIPNPTRENDQAPAYIPQVSLALSVAYGVLKDLFGADQANNSFKKLVEEFSGNLKDIETHLEKISANLNKGKTSKDVEVPTGIARFKLLGRFVATPGDAHSKGLDRNLKTALQEIHQVFRHQEVSLSLRTSALKKMDDWIKIYKNGQPPFALFLNQSILPMLGSSKTNVAAELLKIKQYIEKENLSPQDLIKIKQLVGLVLISDVEYEFMRGKAGMKRKELLEAAISKPSR